MNIDYCYETRRMRWVLSDICVELGLPEMADQILGAPVGKLPGFATSVYKIAIDKGYPTLAAALVTEGFTYGA